MADNKHMDSQELMRQVDVLGQKIDQLRIEYEKYFQGVIREEPFFLAQEVGKMVRRLTTANSQNAALRFRLQQMVAKYNTYNTMWLRTLRQIEEGTHRRDRFRAKLAAKQAPSSAKKKPQQDTKKSDENNLFQEYLAAKQACKENTRGLDAKRFAETLAKQKQALAAKMPGKDIQFRVVQEDGKARIKAFVKK